MNTAQKIANLEKQRAAHVAKLQALQLELDEAADANDATLVGQLQSEVNAAAPMIASFDRRLEKARAEDTEAARQTRRDANMKHVETLARAHTELRKLAVGIPATIAQLAKQLEALQPHGIAAHEAVLELVKQIPFRDRPYHWNSTLHASGMQSIVGAAVEDMLCQYGIFRTLAPNADVTLRHHGLPAMDELLETSGGKLHARVRQIAKSINEGI